jgi:hypothetical protein
MKALFQPVKSFASAASATTTQRRSLKTITDNRPTAIAQRKIQDIVQMKSTLQVGVYNKPIQLFGKHWPVAQRNIFKWAGRLFSAKPRNVMYVNTHLSGISRHNPMGHSSADIVEPNGTKHVINTSLNGPDFNYVINQPKNALLETGKHKPKYSMSMKESKPQFTTSRTVSEEEGREMIARLMERRKESPRDWNKLDNCTQPVSSITNQSTANRLGFRSPLGTFMRALFKPNE